MTVVLKMGKQKKHPGDDGDWNLGSAEDPVGSIRERVDSNVTLTSQEQMQVMREEEAFIASVADQFPMKRFTDRRSPPDRDHVMPHGTNRQIKVKGGSYITQRD